MLDGGHCPESVAEQHEGRDHRRASDVSAQHRDMVTVAERAGFADETLVAPTQVWRLRAGR
jgi:hypothetical protein